MRKALYLFVVFVTLVSFTMAQPAQPGSRPGIAPDNLFYPAEKFVEGLEVELAGLIGGKSLKARAIANNAEERLAEAKKMKDRNNSVRAEKLVEQYRAGINKSKRVAAESSDNELENRIDGISKKNIEVLNEVKARTPEEAQDGLERALNASQKRSNTINRTQQPNLSEEAEGVFNQSTNQAGLPNQTSEDVIENISEKLSNTTEETSKQLNDSENVIEDQNLESSNSVTGQATEKSEEILEKDSPSDERGSDSENPSDALGLN